MRPTACAGALVTLSLGTGSVARAAESAAPHPVGAGDVAAWLALVALAPFVVVLLSAFVKTAVVLAILRAAFGPRTLPPASVATALALLLTLFVMAPVGEKVWRAVEPGLARGDAASLAIAARDGAEPLREFLVAHTPARERQSFVDLQRRLRPPEQRATVSDADLIVLAPAFVVAELRAAFEIGFLLLLPFLVVELVIANLLAVLGMQALDPRAVALPFKLLLFVLADGWHLLARGLVLGYT